MPFRSKRVSLKQQTKVNTQQQRADRAVSLPLFSRKLEVEVRQGEVHTWWPVLVHSVPGSQESWTSFISFCWPQVRNHSSLAILPWDFLSRCSSWWRCVGLGARRACSPGSLPKARWKEAWGPPVAGGTAPVLPRASFTSVRVGGGSCPGQWELVGASRSLGLLRERWKRQVQLSLDGKTHIIPHLLC